MTDIKTFFEQSEGKWFTQRTRYNLAHQKVENGQAELTVELLNWDHQDIVNLCQSASQPQPDKTFTELGGVKVSWEANQEKGSNLIAVIPEDETLQKGRFIQNFVHDDKAPSVGQFVVGVDEALTLSSEPQPNCLIKERLWFAHPNLRLRTVWQEQQNGHQGWVMFYSEIRRLNS